MQPIFLLSLPRSGSTLTQRMLGAHPEIHTVSEPWILLPLTYSLRSKGIWAEYDQSLAAMGIDDFSRHLPKGRDDLRLEIRELMLRTYAKAAQRDVRYFLDKTPRYHFIAQDLFEMFPGGKFIFLWRNPLATLGSFIEFFGHGQWNLYAYEIDLYDGLSRLIDVYTRFKNRAYGLRYEDLVADSPAALLKAFTYLELDAQQVSANSFTKVPLEGRLGDHTGSKTYNTISREPLDKWKQYLANPLRKNWARRYLTWIGEERLALMGYSLTELSKELNDLPGSSKYLSSDLVRMTFGAWLAKRRTVRHTC